MILSLPMRAKTATMKPKAAGSAASLAGTTSCKALQARPPSGKESIKRGKTEGESVVETPAGGKQAAQFVHDRSTASRLGKAAGKIGGKSSGLGHSVSLLDFNSPAVLPWISM